MGTSREYIDLDSTSGVVAFLCALVVPLGILANFELDRVKQRGLQRQTEIRKMEEEIISPIFNYANKNENGRIDIPVESDDILQHMGYDPRHFYNIINGRSSPFLPNGQIRVPVNTRSFPRLDDWQRALENYQNDTEGGER